MAEHQVVFYECQDIPNRTQFDRLAAVRDLNNLADQDWRVTDHDGMEMGGHFVHQDGTHNSPTRIVFLRIRQDELHLLSAARQLTLWQPPAGDEFSEVTHAVIWPDNFMAAVTNRDAPPHKRLAHYFCETSGQQTHIVNLFNPDVVARLRELRAGGLRNINVKVKTSHIAQLEQDRRVRGFRQLWNAGRGTNVATIGIELGVGRQRDAHLDDSLAEEAEALATMGDLLESMTVRGPRTPVARSRPST